MLHFEAIDNNALVLLRNLLKESAFKELRLVGGTSLALQFGHRKSIDLDLFGSIEADNFFIGNEINKFGSVTTLQNLPNLHTYIIDGIKVDIVNYSYPWISDLIVENEIRLANPIDIGAMKLAAITGRGSKKDFVDLYFLLKHFTLKELLSFYDTKYKDGSVFMVLKSLTYFVDAEEDLDPVYFTPVKWNDIKQKIIAIHSEYLKTID